VDAIEISQREVQLFDCSIEFALLFQRRKRLATMEELWERWKTVIADRPDISDYKQGPLYFRRPIDNCLVVSFDSGWYPFLDDSIGYNRPEKRCWYVPKNSLLDHVVEAMRNLHLPQNGGRTFLHANGAMCSENADLVRWTLAVPSEFLLPRRGLVSA
jgi:hypothetical protein